MFYNECCCLDFLSLYLFESSTCCSTKGSFFLMFFRRLVFFFSSYIPVTSSVLHTLQYAFSRSFCTDC